MKSQFFKIVAGIGLLLIVAGLSLKAQRKSLIVAEVPSGFSVGNQLSKTFESKNIEIATLLMRKR